MESCEESNVQKVGEPLCVHWSVAVLQETSYSG